VRPSVATCRTLRSSTPSTRWPSARYSLHAAETRRCSL